MGSLGRQVLQRNSLSAIDARTGKVIRDWVGPDEAKDFELLILDPDHYTADEVAELKKSGAILIAYHNIK